MFQNNILNIDKKTKGSALYFALAIMSLILAIGLSLANLLIFQFKMIRTIGDSVVAFYIADTGVEDSLYKIYIEGESIPFSSSSTVEIVEGVTRGSYSVDVLEPGSSCSGAYYCIRSKGVFNNQRRAIEARN